MMELAKDDIVKNEILKAAERVFQKYGLNKTTMEDIAHEAGKGKSTLYYYFQSKEEIFNTVVDLALNYVINKGWESTLNVSSAKEKLKIYLITTLREMKNYVTAFEIVKTEMKRNYKFMEEMRARFNPQEEKIIRTILHEGVKSKEFKYSGEKELTLAVKATLGIIHALELYLLLENDDIEQIDIAVKLIAEGF